MASFTHDVAVSATASFVGKAGECAVKSTPDGLRYVEVKWPGDLIYPGDHKTNSRSLTLVIKAASWQPADDWSHANLDKETRIISRIPVYQADRLIEGQAP